MNKPLVNKRKPLRVQDFVKGVRQRDRTILARTITLVESNALSHVQQAQEVLTHLMPHTGNSIRIGITGVPGAGKSTLIEALGLHILQQGHRVAVLTVDPSSSISGGSILGDKTRMEKLSRHQNAYIRPSPSQGTLGGVSRKTRESMLICEAAGFDVILIETMGVGQSEIAVRSMVDFFLLLQITGGGDELQGIKRGILELGDGIVINKADGDNQQPAKAARQELARALHYLTPYTEGWKPYISICSALKGTGIPELWDTIQTFKEATRQSGILKQRRRQQARAWMHEMVKASLQEMFLKHPAVRKELSNIENAVMNGELPATGAAQKLLEMFKQSL